MSAIQNTASWWIDGFARLSGTSGNPSSLGQNPDVWGTTESDSFTSVVSDVEEEGEAEPTHEETETESSVADDLTEEIEAGSDEFSSSNEIVAAVAAHIGIIEAALRKHQATGMATFMHDHSDEDPAGRSHRSSLAGDLVQDPALAFSATLPRPDRMGILSLLQ